jgi:transposase InsO family protein
VIKNLAAAYPVERLCQILEVARSGYYRWGQRPPGQRAQANQQLLAGLREAFAKSRRTYGSPRLTRQLQSQGLACSENRVARLMRRHQIQARPRRAFRPRTTDSRHGWSIAPNRLRPAGVPASVNQIWVADITYLPTRGGWVYLAGVMDLCSRKIVGWSLGYTLHSSLVEGALEQALARYRPGAGLLHHSDRGSQYAGSAFQELLRRHHIRPSMSASGHCYDNAHMESFWSTLKNDLIHRQSLRDLFQTRSALFEYIEIFYNRQRLHSALNYQSPVDFEQTLTYKQ